MVESSSIMLSQITTCFFLQLPFFQLFPRFPGLPPVAPGLQRRAALPSGAAGGVGEPPKRADGGAVTLCSVEDDTGPSGI